MSKKKDHYLSNHTTPHRYYNYNSTVNSMLLKHHIDKTKGLFTLDVCFCVNVNV